MREAGINTNETKAGLFTAEAARKAESATIDLGDADRTVYANAAMDLAVLQPDSGETNSRESFMQMLEAA